MADLGQITAQGCAAQQFIQADAASRRGLIQALGRAGMSIVNQPLFYVALSFAGMFLCAWLFDRAYRRHMPETGEPEPTKPPLSRALLNMSGAILVAVVLWAALYKTNMVVVDLLLLVALASFAIGSYKIRLRPLLVHGLTIPHLAALIIALGLWAIPMLWFFHLHLAASYGAA